MIKAIIFDCFGVLTTDLWKEFVASLPAEQREPAHNLNHALDAGKISQSVFFQQVHQLTGKSVPMVEQTIAVSRDKNQPLLAYIRTLKAKYRIGILSNVSDDFITNEFLNTDELELFDVVVASHAIGVVKPDPGAFKIVAKKLGVVTDECVFVDDSPKNCQGARAVGMKTILYKNLPELQKQLALYLND